MANRDKKTKEQPGKLRWIVLGALLVLLGGGSWFAATDPQAREIIDGWMAAAEEAATPPPVPAPPPVPETRWTYTDDNGVIIFVKKRSEVPPKYRGGAREIPAG